MMTFAGRTMSKRKLPDTIPTACAVMSPQSQQDTEETLTANEATAILPETPPRRIQKGSPADDFLSFTAGTVSQSDALTCNLELVPKDQYNRRRRLIAVVIGVEQIKTKGNFTRRNVILRDAHNECEVCVWGNHTHLLNESSIGRPVTLNRICLTEFLEKVAIHMPKDSSVNLGASPDTVAIMQWFNQSGHTSISVENALELPKSDIVAITGILGRVLCEIVTNKDGQTENITTLYIVSGPPRVFVTVDFINPKQEKIDSYKVIFNYVKTSTNHIWTGYGTPCGQGIKSAL
jgi:hypothetical protein